MPYSNDLRSITKLLLTGDEHVPPSLDPPSRRDGDLTSNFFLIFSVQELVELKQDAQRLVRRLGSLCLLVSSCVAALVGLWLLEVVFRR